MKNEEFYDILGDIDADVIKEAEEVPVRKSRIRWLKYGAAAAACAGFVACMGVWYAGTGDKLVTEQGSSYSMTAGNMIIAEAGYPEMPEYPDESKYSDEEFNEAFNKWSEAKRAMREMPEGYKDGFDAFFTKSTETFLTPQSTENVTYSPVSLFFTLGMSAEITGGSTRQQILDVLGKKDIASLRSQAKDMWRANYINDGMAKCLFADSLWTNSGMGYNADTFRLLAENYYASSYSGDPASDEYNKMLQSWLNEQTDGLLSDYVSDIKMDPQMIISLASAVNYSGKWTSKFSAENTKKSVFHGPDGDVECDFMNAQRSMSYSWGDKFAAVSMGLENNGSMRVILPDEGTAPAELFKDNEALEYMLSGYDYPNQKHPEVTLSVPKFDVSSKIDLTNGLKQLGITDAFDASASDFTPLTDQQDAFIGSAEQDVRVMIDEEGCKAAAVTVMAVSGTSLPTDQVDFIVDRPFVFEIVSETGLPLFVGIVNNPLA